MKKYLLAISPFIFIMVSSSKIFAQTAAFTYSPQSGCAPLNIAFTDLSTGATSWHWDFGNGDTSALQNPLEVYSSQGMFTITLSINGGISWTRQQLQIQ